MSPSIELVGLLRKEIERRDRRNIILLDALNEIAHMAHVYLSIPEQERVPGGEIAGDCLREARAALKKVNP